MATGKPNKGKNTAAIESNGTMGTWCKRKIEKKNRGSQTPGRSKAETCQADVMKKYFARRSRSYKHAQYGDWCRKMDSLNLGSRIGE